MEKQAFQEPQEAAEKLQRAKLPPASCPPIIGVDGVAAGARRNTSGSPGGVVQSWRISTTPRCGKERCRLAGCPIWCVNGRTRRGSPARQPRKPRDRL